MIDRATRATTIPMLTAALLLAVSGCREITNADPLEYPDAVQYFEVSLFPQWWNELEACSGISRPLPRVGFFYVRQKTLPGALNGIRIVGNYFPRSNRIFVVEAEAYNRVVVRHEMMHALLRDESGHPPKYFGENGVCGFV